MNGAEHAAFRRLLDAYADTVPDLAEECEQCAAPRSSTRAIRLTTPHKETVFARVKAKGFDTGFLKDVPKAAFSASTEAALIDELYKAGDHAWLCTSCARLWVKLHATLEDERK